MKYEYFVDNLSDEIIEDMTDKMLRFEKNRQNKNIKRELLKIIPAVAAIVFVIGLINMLPIFNGVDVDIPGASGAIIEESDTKPFLYLSADDISEVTVELIPPFVSHVLNRYEIKELTNILHDVEIYEQDDSYNHYYGQAVNFVITKTDGSKIEIIDYNPFIVIDGVGYRTKYEPCEELNKFANDIAGIKYETEPKPVENTPGPKNLWTVKSGITLRLAQDSYLPGTTEMTLILENRSAFVMSYGQGWSFEKYINGEWRKLECIDNYGFNSLGYTLNEYDKQFFEISTWFLKEPLDVGLYRVTGCSLRVAMDSENLVWNGTFIEYPPYQLEFTVSNDAVIEPDCKPIPMSELSGWQLPEIEDWQWYTWAHCNLMYRNAGFTDWTTIKSEGNGRLFAVLYRENTPENEILNIGDKLKMDIFDRQTGRRYEVFTEPKFEYDKVSAYQDGFIADCGELFYCHINENDEVVIELMN